MKGFKNKYASVAEDPLLKQYFTKRKVSKSSQEQYALRMQMYRHVTGLTPTEAIDQADEDEEDGIRLRRRQIVQHLNDFEDFLDNIGYSENTIKVNMAFVRSFYRFHDIIELPVSKRASRSNQYAENVSKLPDTKDIIKGISFSNVKYQAIIVLLASSGMRQGDLRNLRIKQFFNAINGYIEEEHHKIGLADLEDMKELRKKIPKNIGPLWWDFKMQKGKRNHTTFSTPESLKFLLTYLETCEIKSVNEYIFPGQGGQQLRTQSLNTYFQVLDRKCKFPERTPIFFRPHNLRKWFGNKGKKTELGYDETRLLMGHRIMDDTGNRYIVPDFEDLYEKYYRSLNAFTIFNKVEVHDLTDKAVRKVKEENVEIRKENKELKDMVLEMKEDIIQIAQDPEKLARLQKQVQNK